MFFTEKKTISEWFSISISFYFNCKCIIQKVKKIIFYKVALPYAITKILIHKKINLSCAYCKLHKDRQFKTVWNLKQISLTTLFVNKIVSKFSRNKFYSGKKIVLLVVLSTKIYKRFITKYTKKKRLFNFKTVIISTEWFYFFAWSSKVLSTYVEKNVCSFYYLFYIRALI